MFEDIKAAFSAAIAADGDQGVSKSLMREAVIEARAAIKYMEASLAKSEKKLYHENRGLEDATRRGGLAAEIGDRETVEVAQRFAAQHGEKVEILQRKIEVQNAELALARREEKSMTNQLKSAQRGGARVRSGDGDAPSGRIEDALENEIEQRDNESLASRQLEELKRRMGK